MGAMHGGREAGQWHIDYITAQATLTVAVARTQVKVVIQSEIKHRDRLKKSM
ncbi:hypothetical protein GJ700_27880 [Duganella sp. FT92W]|uniref:Uncharacterized protein n=1 Tax=Pseudoduganella rivuli TaxID=2666085 RepID=A0A7X2LW20_9BURK|nr:hypothetical protein [Pseudoduganella rivuli]MRV75543.1 hypothetical protein [Pseudoduganella rivuli]